MVQYVITSEFQKAKFRFPRQRRGDQISIKFRCDPAKGGPKGDSARAIASAYLEKQIKTPGGKFVAFIFFSALLLVGWVNLDASSPEKMPEDNIREIVLEIRNMTFGDNNPTLYLKPKETVRFVILNLDTGMKHNFLIRETDVATQILDYGQKEAVLFTAPAQEGELDYLCSLHALIMRGRLVIGDARLSKKE